MVWRPLFSAAIWARGHLGYGERKAGACKITGLQFPTHHNPGIASSQCIVYANLLEILTHVPCIGYQSEAPQEHGKARDNLRRCSVGFGFFSAANKTLIWSWGHWHILSSSPLFLLTSLKLSWLRFSSSLRGWWLSNRSCFSHNKMSYCGQGDQPPVD